MDISLEKEMKEDVVVIAYLENKQIGVTFYRALCNMQWKKRNFLTTEEQTIAKLKGIQPDVWSCSWRYAGGIIADIRNKHYNANEDYLDFYCSGQEGFVHTIVKECFDRMGWEPVEWDQPHNNYV